MAKNVKPTDTLIRNIENIKTLFTENKVKVFGIGAYPSTRSEIRPLLDDFEIICANKTGEFASVSRKVKVSCFRVKTGRLNPYPVQNPEEILLKRSVITHIRKNSTGKRVGIYIYKPSQKIEKICRANGWTMVANRNSVFDKLAGKDESYRVFQKAGIKREFQAVPLKSLEKKLPGIFSRFGNKIVLQFPREGGGRGTFFFHRGDLKKINSEITKRIKAAEIKNLSKSVLVSKYIEGPSLSISGCITRDNGILCDSLRYQLIDIAEAKKIDHAGVFCGNDWTLAKNIPSFLDGQAKKFAMRVGGILKSAGALGMFGIDFIWRQENNDLIPIEINSRLLGTTPVSVYVHLQKKQIPLEAFHLLEFFNIPYKISNSSTNKNIPSVHGCHLILYNQASGNVRIGNELKGGVYTLTNAPRPELKYLRPGFELDDIKNKNEFVLTDGVPTKELSYKKGRKLFRLIAKKSLVKKTGRELNSWGRTVVSRVQSCFDIHPSKILNTK